MVGTKPNKNLDRMLKALKGFELEVKIVGNLADGQRAQFERYRVPFTALGVLTDAELLRAYQDCDLLAFASTYEGFGLPILEAQAIGRPVVTSNLSSMPEVAGEGALLADPEDVCSMRACFERLLQNPALRESLIEKGFANVPKFSPEKVAARYGEIYRNAREVPGSRREV